jgi:hypothetical protein
MLHDFCLCIPYGGILTLAGLVSLFFKGGTTGLALMGAGAVVEILAGLSLGSWRQGKSSSVFVVGSAGVFTSTPFSLRELTSS